MAACQLRLAGPHRGDIEGREMYVGIIGNDNPEALPIIELDLSKLPEGTPRIAAAEVK